MEQNQRQLAKEIATVGLLIQMPRLEILNNVLSFAAAAVTVGVQRTSYSLGGALVGAGL
jgi:hypothetical protein